MKRKPRKKRPKHIKIDGYDSIWEFILHDTLLKEWEHHSEKVEYTVKHTHEPDFRRTLQNKTILLESKGRFWDHAEYSKYIWIRENLPKNTELVFLFANPSAPMPNAKVRKDGTKRSHGEWASVNGFTWYSEDTLPDKWVNMKARETEEFLLRKRAAEEGSKEETNVEI